ncbi:cytochrome-c oxidase, cbb3-type subunit III [Benzoatithermus flavus]|uniref:Cbb3-type cytochrome c oxidase subunit n=1 Tax=Benzoatithermus flavus TaxID=3108223 RepID=A0ABU8XS58_9PROT
MATKAEKDAVTGVETTGHEWDGIKELNNPLPKWWVYTFYATIAFSVLWWVLYPSWPWKSGHTGGVLGSNQRVELEQRLADARALQAKWLDEIKATDTAAIEKNPELLQFAVAGGEKQFKNNCAPCHGLGGAGQGVYPTLADDDWLWGGQIDQIEYTIRHGIRNGQDPEARDNVMPSFGADGILKPEQIDQVVQYVLSLTDRATDKTAAEQGATVFAENCASCHGEKGEGIKEMGAPALNDAIWLYGGEPAQIAAQINRPKLGVMPNWQGRLDETAIKMLAVYVHNLGGGQ